MKTKEELIDWLRDAYAMEKAMESALKKQINNDKLPLEARELASIHFTETEGHAEAVHACLHKLGADVSTLKTALAQGMEVVKGYGTMFARDEHIKDILAAYASEQADKTPVPEEEVSMAEKLQANLPDLIKSYLRDSTKK